tara:strand:+ start:23084 stop:24478 length:1395 start_codon:yes stop_codon:yes gene_type:complete
MLTSLGLKIPYDKEIQQKLTIRPEVNKDYCFDGNPSYKIYSLSKTGMYVPRNFELDVAKHTMFQNNIRNGLSCSHLEFVGTLKESTNQIEASDTTYNRLVDETDCLQRQYTGNAIHCGILSLPTGYGKTTVSLHIMCRLKLKTLIIVHKEFLMNQWIDRISQFVPSARIGIIQGPKCEIVNKDVVIGMLQSLSQKDYDRDLFKEFGFTIIDETHHICTRMFSKFLMKYNTKYLLGLSATIDRKDGLTYVIHWLMGPVLYQTHRERKNDVVVRKYSIHINEYEEPFPLNKAGKANLSCAINILTESNVRNQTIISIIKECLQSNRKLLILTDRRNHCIELSRMCDFVKNGLYIGGMKQDELTESESCPVIFGTFTLAHEGLDIPSLDTLILATPKSDIVQAVGRILRETLGKTNHPLVIDLIDHWGVFKAQYYKRHKYYKSTGFTILNESLENEETPIFDFIIDQ